MISAFSENGANEVRLSSLVGLSTVRGFTINLLATTLALSVLLVGYVSSAHAAVSVTTLPFSVDFDTSAYAPNLVRATSGCQHEWEETGGWRGGAAKFYPGGDEFYCGLGLFEGISANNGTQDEQLNVRFLIYYGRNYARSFGSGNKLIIMNRGGISGHVPAGRIISMEKAIFSGDARYLGPSACLNIACVFESGQSWPMGDETLRIGANYRHGEWISIELEANARTGDVTLYVHTQDGVFNGPFIQTNMDWEGSGTGGYWAYIDLIGGYFQGSVADPLNYMKFDELVISNQYIGPPAGFSGSAVAPPAAPTSTSVGVVE